MNAQKSQLDALTGARGIAAWLVVLYHVRSAFPDAVPQAMIGVFAKGYLAVDLFFILSGFVMWLNYGNKFADQGFGAAREFLVRRIARIYPLHFAVLTMMVGYALLLWAQGKAGFDHYPFAELPLHFLLMQNWGFTAHLTWNDPAWSISTELGAYFVFALVAPMLAQWRANWAVCVGVIALVGIALGSWMVWRDAATLGHGIVYNGLVRCIAEFFMGVFVCRLWLETQGDPRRRLTWGAALSVLALGLLWANDVVREHFAAPLLFAASVTFLAGTSGMRGNPLASRFAVYVGEISYSTYLIHFFLWILFKKLLDDAHNVPLPVMLVFFGLTFAVSALLYRGIEQPGRVWFQAISGRMGLRAGKSTAKAAE